MSGYASSQGATLTNRGKQFQEPINCVQFRKELGHLYMRRTIHQKNTFGVDLNDCVSDFFRAKIEAMKTVLADISVYCSAPYQRVNKKFWQLRDSNPHDLGDDLAREIMLLLEIFGRPMGDRGSLHFVNLCIKRYEDTNHQQYGAARLKEYLIKSGKKMVIFYDSSRNGLRRTLKTIGLHGGVDTVATPDRRYGLTGRRFLRWLVDSGNYSAEGFVFVGTGQRVSDARMEGLLAILWDRIEQENSWGVERAAVPSMAYLCSQLKAEDKNQGRQNGLS